jgi:catechol 2,3-dioxygenase-like lactoylglutathione lyase family enzyme
VIERIENVGVAVTDLERAVAFYTRLGFKVEARDESTRSAMLRGGEARLWIFETRRRSADHRSLSLDGNPTGDDHLSPDENRLFLLGELKGK